MFRLKHVSWAAAALCAGSFSAAAVAQQQQPAPAPKLERVEITGSNIKRLDAETVAPVEVITREQIQRTGQPTVADVLRNIPANSGSFGESFSNSFAPGAAGISLRGLGQKTTLVLINGRRTSGYGFAQNLQDTFVDLNSIPSAAVERIDILKDGASAIYGSDAIAGVVNVILRKDYRGFEASASLGQSEGKGDARATLTGGAGDLGADKYNVFATLDVYKRDELMMSDTKFGASRDMRGRYAGGRNFQSATGGGTWRQLSATGALTSNYRAISGCQDTVMTGTELLAAGLTTSATVGAATNTFCVRDVNKQLAALPGTQRIGLLSRGTFELSPTATAFAEVGISRVETDQTFTAPFFAGTTALTPNATGTLSPFTYNFNFAPGVSGNPFSTNARMTGSFSDLGLRTSNIVSDTSRILLGAKYTLADWDFDSGLGFSKNEVKQQNNNRLSQSGVNAVFGATPVIGQPIPTVTSTTYNLDSPSTNSQADRDRMLISFPRKSTSELSFIDTRASTVLANLPSGDVGLAVGFEHRQEKMKDVPAAVAAAGDVLGQGITATNGKRDNTSVFAELSLPLAKTLEGQVALRHDKYSDYGASTTPKVGVKFRPNDQVMFRANWGKGFRAPSLPEISPSQATFFTSVIDPEDGQSRQISGVFAGNPNLKAETSLSKTVGIVLEPTKNFNVSVDLYKLTWNNVVSSRSFQDIIDESCPSGGPGCPTTPNVARDPDTGFVTTIFSNYENLAQRSTSGGDLDVRWTVPSDLGKFTFRTNVNYVKKFYEDGTNYAGSNGGSNTIPRVKGAFSVDYDQGSWAVTGRANYTHSYKQDLLPASYFTGAGQTAASQTGVYPERVRSHSTYDLFVRYAVSKSLSVSGAVINIQDTLPPYDPGFSSTYLYDFSQYDVRGRQFRLNLSYKM